MFFVANPEIRVVEQCFCCHAKRTFNRGISFGIMGVKFAKKCATCGGLKIEKSDTVFDEIQQQLQEINRGIDLILDRLEGRE
jgi:Zn finger protein HypA/HybF involved in hydrogenase expression